MPCCMKIKKTRLWRFFQIWVAFPKLEFFFLITKRYSNFYHRRDPSKALCHQVAASFVRRHSMLWSMGHHVAYQHGGGDAGSNPPSTTKAFSSLFKASEASSSTSPLRTIIHTPLSNKGEPDLKIHKSTVESLSKPFCYTPIGKFSHGRPSKKRSRLIFAKLGLKGAFSLGHLDLKHKLISLQDESDFNRLLLRELQFMDGFPMWLFWWIPSFKPDVESPADPVWDSLPNLPLFLFNKQSPFLISSLIGKLLTLDAVMEDLSHPNVARLCVEVDLLKRLPHRVWPDCETNDGFWKDIIYEKLTSYCKYCKRLGQDISICKMAHPELAKSSMEKQKPKVFTAMGREALLKLPRWSQIRKKSPIMLHKRL